MYLYERVSGISPYNSVSDETIKRDFNNEIKYANQLP